VVGLSNKRRQKVLGRRERKREQTKQGLINAAIDLFVAKGYDETTIDDIAAAADVAKVTFYYYFKSKEEIVLAIKESGAEELLGRMEKLFLEKVSASEILRTFFLEVGNWTEKNWQLLQVFATQKFGSMVKGETCAEEDKAAPMILLVERIILYGQNSGQFRKESNAREMAHFVMWALMHEQFTWIHEGRKKTVLLKRLENCLDFILNGIGSRK
jgi:AcrR family transcriptional regulator